MAESVVKLILEKLSSFLMQEAALVGKLSYELGEVKMELESIHSFLMEIDRRKDNSEVVRTWVNQVRDVAFDIEDAIDEFMYLKDQQHRRGLKGFLSYPSELMEKRRLATQIQLIKRRVQAISERRSRYAVSWIEEGTRSYNVVDTSLRRGEISFSVDSDHSVGLTEKLDLLVGWLTEEEPHCMVVSVVGMGGVGKTTLVAKALSLQTVKKHFDCYAWASVSQSYRIDELLRGLIKELFEAKKEEIPSDLGTINTRQLTQFLNNYLKSKRYVIVLDDVWSIDVLNDIKVAFPDNRSGSRVVLTTRKEDVARAAGEGSRTYPLQPLFEEEAWELFCKKAFWKEPGRRCPPSLEPLARAIVKKCEGLPLAVVALGGLLSLKDANALEWDIINNSLSWELSNNEMLKRMKSILLLSYNDLPYYLKHCFVYCSIFPEDYAIKRKRLIRLWVAEGFVEERGRLTMEEVAESYLKELLRRHMLQVAKTNHFGRVKACRMHDLIRDLALSICKEERFFMNFDGQETMTNIHARRLAVYKRNETVQLSPCTPRLRSLFVFTKDVSSSFSKHSTESCFRLLRVLDLEGVPIVNVPNELAELFNLRYLNLKGTRVRELPKSIGRLRSLQTLNVSDTNIEKLPNGVVELRNLRHLLTYGVNSQVTRSYKSYNLFSSVGVPKGVCYLKSLQTLCCIQAKGDIVRQVGNLTQLRLFAIMQVRATDGPELCASVCNMNSLLTLGVVAINEKEPLQLDALSCPPPRLQKLVLGGRMEKMPHWLSSLTHLTYLYLFWSQLQEETLSSLQALPNLVLLQLAKANEGRELCFQKGWFPALKKLRLCDLAQLNLLMVEDGALPLIQQLAVLRCRELKSVPLGVEYLAGLQELYLEEMPEEFVDRLREDKSEDRQRVKHIPIIEHSYRREHKWVVERLS